jgi:hypothetical protein
VVNDKQRRRARRREKRQRTIDQRSGGNWVAGMVLVQQDVGDDCPVCLFIRARADCAGPGGMIPLSAAEVAELQAVMRG